MKSDPGEERPGQARECGGVNHPEKLKRDAERRKVAKRTGCVPRKAAIVSNVPVP